MAAAADLIITNNILDGDLSANNILSGDEVTSRDVTYALVGETGSRILLNISTSDYKMTAILQDKNGNTIYTSNVIDLPLESVVVNGSYDSVNKKIILTLQNGNTIEFSVADLVSGLQTEITVSNKLSADLVDDTNTTNKFVTASDKTNWNAKVGTTDYATSSTGGVIKSANKLKVSSAGVPYVEGLTYSDYEAADPNIFIGKTTLENVLTERIGDIESALVSI